MNKARNRYAIIKQHVLYLFKILVSPKVWRDIGFQLEDSLFESRSFPKVMVRGWRTIQIKSFALHKLDICYSLDRPCKSLIFVSNPIQCKHCKHHNGKSISFINTNIWMIWFFNIISNHWDMLFYKSKKPYHHLTIQRNNSNM